MDRSQLEARWEEMLRQYNPHDTTVSQFVSDFCTHFRCNKIIESWLSDVLLEALPRYDDGSSQSLEARFKFLTPSLARNLLKSAEIITFRKGEVAMLHYLVQQEFVDFRIGKNTKFEANIGDFYSKAEEILKASEAWYKLSSVAKMRFYDHAYRLLEEMVNRCAWHPLSQSTLGEQDAKIQTDIAIFNAHQGPASLRSNSQLSQNDMLLESGRLTAFVIHSMREDADLDLTYETKELHARMVKKVRKVKEHYENEMIAVARAGHLPRQTPPPQELENVLRGLLRHVRHVYSRRKGDLGSHEAFVRKMFSKHFGSLLLTSTPNSFDHYVGSAFELTEMILGQLLPANIPLDFPINGNTWTSRYRSFSNSLSTYRQLCLTSHRTRELVHSVLMKRVELQVDPTRKGFDKAIVRALKKYWPFPFARDDGGGVSKQNLFALIPRLKLSFLYGTSTNSKRRTVAHQHISALLRTMSGLATMQFDMSSGLQRLAFSDHGQPASWLVDAIESIPGNATFEFHVNGIPVHQFDFDQSMSGYDNASDHEIDTDHSDITDGAETVQTPADGHLLLAFRAFLEVSQRLIDRDSSTAHLREVDSNEEKAKSKAPRPSAIMFVSTRFYNMMSQVLRERGENKAADWFEGVEAETTTGGDQVVTG